MRKIIYLILSVSFCSCSQTLNNEAEKDKLESAILNSENIKDFNDKIFMNFRFGMSKDEVNDHFQTLLDSGKITLGSDGTFKYLFKTREGDILTSFSTKYYDDRLCEFVVKFQKMNNEIYSSPELIMQFAQDVFREKAINEGYDFYIDSIGTEHLYYYIKNATIIKFSSFIEPYMAYICAPLCKMKNEEIEHEKENKVRDAASDL